MVTKDAVSLIRKYIASLSDHDIRITKVIIFGSFARGDFNDDSDIDLILVSPDFDTITDSAYALLWKLTRVADYKIEPIPVSEDYFNSDTGSPIIESAKLEGIELLIA